MKLPRGPWDGAQPRGYVLDALKRFGVEVYPQGGDWYELIDRDGDPVVIQIPNPVLSDMIVYLYRRFGELHGFKITALCDPKRRH